MQRVIGQDKSQWRWLSAGENGTEDKDDEGEAVKVKWAGVEKEGVGLRMWKCSVGNLAWVRACDLG